MSPEIESHGLELTEKVFSEEAVHLVSGGKGGVEPGKLRSLNRDGSQPYLLTGQPDLEALGARSRLVKFEAVSTTNRIFPCEVARSTTGRLYTGLKSISVWSGSSARRPADKNKPTRTTATWDAVLGIRPGFVHFAVRATFPTSHGEGKRALD